MCDKDIGGYGLASTYDFKIIPTPPTKGESPKANTMNYGCLFFVPCEINLCNSLFLRSGGQEARESRI